MKNSKYKIGDIVVCKPDESGRKDGRGFKSNMCLKIESIDNYNDFQVLFFENWNNGVYDNSVFLGSKEHKIIYNRLNKPYNINYLKDIEDKNELLKELRKLNLTKSELKTIVDSPLISFNQFNKFSKVGFLTSEVIYDEINNIKGNNLIEGRWYKLSDGKSSIKPGYYIKFKNLDSDNIVRSSEHISPYSNKFEQTLNHPAGFGALGEYTYILLEDLSTIQGYLPDNHPDKIKINKHTDFIFTPGEYYVGTWGSNSRVIFKPDTNSLEKGCHLINTTNTYHYNEIGCCSGPNITFRKATDHERTWLNNCILANKTVPEFTNKVILEPEEWIPKVGDWIVYDDTDVSQVKSVREDIYYKYWIDHTYAKWSGGGFGWNAYKHKIRKAEPYEIPKTDAVNLEAEKILKMSMGTKYNISDFIFKTPSWINTNPWKEDSSKTKEIKPDLINVPKVKVFKNNK